VGFQQNINRFGVFDDFFLAPDGLLRASLRLFLFGKKPHKKELNPSYPWRFVVKKDALE